MSFNSIVLSIVNCQKSTFAQWLRKKLDCKELLFMKPRQALQLSKGFLDQLYWDL